jgi:hypothetical protein
MSQSSEVLRGYVSKNSSTPMLLLEDMLVKLVPSARVEKIKDEILRVAYAGEKNGLKTVLEDLDVLKKDISTMNDQNAKTASKAIDDIKGRIDSAITSKNNDHLEKLLNVLLFDPAVCIFGGVGCEISSAMSTRSLDSRLDSTISRKVQEMQINSESENKEILYYIHSLVANRGRDSSDDKITSMDLARERISFSIENLPRSMEKRVFATITVPSFRIRYVSSSSIRSHSGVWQFSECMLGTQMIATRTSAARFTIGFSKVPYVLFPVNYCHPYVYVADNNFCTGSFQGSAAEVALLRMDPIDGVFQFLKQVMHIFTTGYHENTSPARGVMLYDPTFDRQKIYDTLEDERDARIRDGEKTIKDEYHAIKNHIHKLEG